MKTTLLAPSVEQVHQDGEMWLDDSALSVEEATYIACNGFGIGHSDSMKEDVRHHLDTSTTYTIYEGLVKVGFVCYQLFGNILYISGIVMLPSAQGHGYAVKVTRLLAEKVGLPFLAYKTQSPRMWSVGGKVCKNWYPNPNQNPNQEILGKIHVLCLCIGAIDFPVSKGFYGHALYTEKPVVKDQAVQAWWDEMCDFHAGDSVVCFGTM